MFKRNVANSVCRMWFVRPSNAIVTFLCQAVRKSNVSLVQTKANQTGLKKKRKMWHQKHRTTDCPAMKTTTVLNALIINTRSRTMTSRRDTAAARRRAGSGGSRRVVTTSTRSDRAAASSRGRKISGCARIFASASSTAT